MVATAVAACLHVLAGATPGLAQAAPPSADDWVVLAPTKTASTGGATFTTLIDGSLLVSGAAADKDVYTLDFETELKGITGFRIEALADDSLPARGPGRASNGNFWLNELRVDATAKLALRFKPVALQFASADFNESRRGLAEVFDGVETTPNNGWAVFGSTGKDHQLVVECADDVRFDGPTLLRFELHFNWGGQHALGRLRLSATTKARPLRAPGSADAQPFSKLQEQINAAIDRGILFLESKQQVDGSWNHEQWTYRNGATALAAYTLLKSGVSPRHPAILRAIEYMRVTPSKETYTLGCQLMALGALDDPANLPWMKQLAEQLLEIQRDGFSYPWGAVDLSNTQYGVMGLRAAAMHGVKVPPEAFERAAQQALQFQHEDGAGAYAPLGFSYNRTSKPTSSMTVAGTLLLAVADEQLKGKAKGAGYATAARRGVEWLAKHWSVEQNQFESHDRWNVYYLYGVERVGSVLSIEKIGEHDWYREGARRLVDTQGGKGEWASAYADHVINTCFALLFLNRATAVVSGKSATRVKLYGADDPSRPVSLRASGDTPLTVWISSFGEKERMAQEWPKEESHGPRVKRVEYLGRGGSFGDAERALATIDGDGARPAGRERFGAQCTFPLPGKYQVRARVTVVSPDGSEAALESPPLEVAIEEAIDPELIEYAKDPGRNLLAGQKVSASASSVINNDWVAGNAADNLQCRGWAAKNEDATPSLTLELEKPVRATTCLITPALVGETYGSRITKLALTVNGKQPPIVLQVAPALDRKVRVKLPQATIVRKLEIKVLERQESTTAEKAVGIAEVELQVEKPGADKP
jgi:hypothetical protein